MRNRYGILHLKRILSMLVKTCAFTLLTLFWSASSHAKPKPQLDHDLANLSVCLDEYDSIPYDDHEWIDSTKEEIVRLLVQALNDPRSLDGRLDSLLTCRSYLRSTHSTDGRVHCYAINERYGGTMHMDRTVLQARYPNGHVRAFVLLYGPKEEGPEIAFCRAIIPLKARRQYMVLMEHRYCSTCWAEGASLLKFVAGDTIEVTRLMDIDSRIFDVFEFDFDAEAQQLCYEYIPQWVSNAGRNDRSGGWMQWDGKGLRTLWEYGEGE